MAAIDLELVKWLKTNFPENSRLLEFGSGHGTAHLTTHFEVFSVEHDPEWIGVVSETQYIHAPIEPDPAGDNWYSWNPLEVLLDQDFPVVLIDGPLLSIGRPHIKNWIKSHSESLLWSNPELLLVVDDCFLSPVLPLITYLEKSGWICFHQGGPQTHPFKVFRQIAG